MGSGEGVPVPRSNVSPPWVRVHLATELENGISGLRTTFGCPILTISPRCSEEYDTKADIFSFALIVQEMIEGRMPFAEKEDSEASEAYASKERPLFKAPSNCFTLMDLKHICGSSTLVL
ncbi:Protein kinase domain protein [Raphanus sativus]|nr:Protein kinase domain protein [Raphanus sativus]